MEDMPENKEQCEQLHPRECVCVLHAEMTINARTKSSISLFCSLRCSAPPFLFIPLATVPLGETFLFNSLYFSAVRAHSPFLLLDLSYAAYHGEFGPHFERGNNK